MAVSASLYHRICREVDTLCPAGRRSSQQRLALLITAIIATQSCVIARLARRIHTLGLSSAQTESIARRFRRTMNDPRLTFATWGAPLIRLLLSRAGHRETDMPLLIVVDESTLEEKVTLLRASLVYRGGALPLAWETWDHWTARPKGAYWDSMDRLFATLSAVLPPQVPVVILADRYYAVPNFTDRVTVHGWHWAIRITTTGSHRWSARRGAPESATWDQDVSLAQMIKSRLSHPGTRLRLSGRYAKKAGWRAANLVGVWGVGEQEPLVVITDLAPRWLVLAWYRRRFWIEAGFRDDKSGGWDWEGSQVTDPAHHQVLLLAMAWATLLSLWLGAEEAASRLRGRMRRPHGTTHARESLATLGREVLQGWVAGNIPRCARRVWRLPHLAGPSWSAEWSAACARSFIFRLPVRP